MDSDVRSAVSLSHLRELPADVLDDLLAGAVRVKVAAGSVRHREGAGAPHLELVVSGLSRVYVTAPDGRTMTVRYCRPGALLGVMSLFVPGFTMPATVQALVDAELLALSPAVARRAAAQDVRVTRAFLREQSERAISFPYEVPEVRSPRCANESPATCSTSRHRAGRSWSRSASGSWRRPSGRSERLRERG